MRRIRFLCIAVLLSLVWPAPGQAAETTTTLQLQTRLKSAIAKTDLAEFNRLLGAADNAAAADSNGKTALMYAAEAGNLEAVARIVPLLDRGKRWGFAFATGESLNPVFRMWNWAIEACFGMYSKMRVWDEKDAYLNRCDALTDSTSGYTALMYASANGHSEVVQYLLNAGANPHTTCLFMRSTALQLAQMGGHANTASIIKEALSNRNLWSRFLDEIPNLTILSIAALLIAIWMLRVFKRRRDAPIRVATHKEGRK